MSQQSHLIFFFIMGIPAIAFFVIGIMLRHHWQTYSPNQTIGRLLQIIYWGIGGMLLAVMIMSYVISFV